MLYHFFNTAWRNWIKYPGYSTLNLLGLSLGLASAFMLLAFSWQQINYDRHFPAGERVYRIASDFFSMGGFAASQEQLLDHLPEICPAVEISARCQLEVKEINIFHGNREHAVTRGIYASEEFFSLFPFPCVQGNLTDALSQPENIVLSLDLSKRIFGGKQAVGQTLSLGSDRKTFTVTAIVDTDEYASHIDAEYWLPLELPKERQEVWTNITYYNYVRLHPGHSSEDLRQGLDVIIEKFAYPSNTMSMSFAEWSESTFALKYFIQPLYDIYLYSNYNFELSAGGNPRLVYILALVGLIIILIAIANYLNLTTARAAVRIKEIGIKKTLGISIAALRLQFILESILFAMLAMSLGLLLSEAIRWCVEHYMYMTLLPPIFSKPNLWMTYVAFAGIIGFISGIYPAFYLAKFAPHYAIKSQTHGRATSLLRNILVTTQFSLAVLLIFCCIVIFAQLGFMSQKDLGFNQDGVIVIDQSDEAKEDLLRLQEQLSSDPQIMQSSICERVPAGRSVSMTAFQTREESEPVTIQTFPVDDKFIPLMNMHLLAGRNFDRRMGQDTNALILNEAAVASLGLENPVGTMLSGKKKVIGVIKDFHFQSLRANIEPAILMYQTSGNSLLLKTTSNHAYSLLQTITTKWESINNQEKLNYSFLDDNFAALAKKDRTLGYAITLFTFLAIFIASLGLLGLVTFAGHQRAKELSIRKVLGASTIQNAMLLISNFLKLMLIAIVIALPLGTFAMQKWLDEFAYRISLEVWTYLVAVAVIMLVTLATLSLQSIRSALQHPIKHLRNE